MLFNVVLDLFLTDGSDTGTEVAPCPQMLSPIAFLQVRKLILQFARGRSFQILSDFGWAQLWRARYQQVDMVNTDMALHDGDVSAQAQLADDFARSFSNFRSQYLVTVFGHPHEVILDVIRRVWPFAILWHSSLVCGNYTLLKLFA